MVRSDSYDSAGRLSIILSPFLLDLNFDMSTFLSVGGGSSLNFFVKPCRRKCPQRRCFDSRGELQSDQERKRKGEYASYRLKSSFI